MFTESVSCHPVCKHCSNKTPTKDAHPSVMLLSAQLSFLTAKTKIHVLCRINSCPINSLSLSLSLSHTYTYMSSYLYESLGSQFLVQLIEGHFASYDARLKSNLAKRAGGCCRVPLGVKTLLLHHRDLHKGTHRVRLICQTQLKRAIKKYIYFFLNKTQ